MNTPSAKDLDLAREVKQRLNGKIEIIDFRIYGSRARGDAEWDSDLDLYIEVPAINKEERRLINSVAWEVGLENDVVITPVVVTREQIINTPFTATTFYQVIEREGIPL
jgi:predicted nucleotidyltransferase